MTQFNINNVIGVMIMIMVYCIIMRGYASTSELVLGAINVTELN